jgi:hypothetical protein
MRNQNNIITIVVRIPRSLLDDIDLMALRYHRSRNGEIARILEESLDDKSREQKRIKLDDRPDSDTDKRASQRAAPAPPCSGENGSSVTEAPEMPAPAQASPVKAFGGGGRAKAIAEKVNQQIHQDQRKIKGWTEPSTKKSKPPSLKQLVREGRQGEVDEIQDPEAPVAPWES